MRGVEKIGGAEGGIAIAASAEIARLTLRIQALVGFGVHALLTYSYSYLLLAFGYPSIDSVHQVLNLVAHFEQEHS